MRRLISFAIIGIVFVCYFAVDYGGYSAKAVPVADDCDWPMYGRTPEGNRVAPDGCGPKTDKLELKWKFAMDTKHFLSPVISNGKLYFNTLEEDCKIYCLNSENGQKIWEYDVKGDIYSSPAISNDNVYFRSFDNKLYTLYCLNTENGKEIWRYKTFDNFQHTISNGKIYCISEGDKLFCLKAETGQKIWEFKEDELIYFSFPLISNGKVYFWSWNGCLYCISAEDGHEFWHNESAVSIVSQSTISNGKAYFESAGNKLKCQSLESGEIIWEYDWEKGPRQSSPPVISHDKVYFGLYDGKLYCLNAESGQEVWEYKTGDWIGSSPAISNGKVYFGSMDHKLYCLNAENGQKVWEYETGDSLPSDPIISNGKVYVGSGDGNLYCFGDAKEEVKPLSVTPTSLSFGTLNRGTSKMEKIDMSFDTNEDIKGTISTDKKWLTVSPATFDSRTGPISIVCNIEASKLPGKVGTISANIIIKYDYPIFINSPGVSLPQGEIVVPVAVETQETIDLELWIGKKFGTIGVLKVALDAPPFIRNGRTLVPVRFISESFGCDVRWEAGEKKIILQRFDQVIYLWTGKKSVLINGKSEEIEYPPVNENGRTYVPIRVISEAFNAMIVWHGNDRKVECSYKPPDDGF